MNEESFEKVLKVRLKENTIDVREELKRSDYVNDLPCSSIRL